MGSRRPTPGWLCIVVMFGCLAAVAYSGRCPKEARAGSPYTFSQITSYNGIESFEWKINSHSFNCKIEDLSCYSKSGSSLYKASVVLRQDGSYNVSVTIDGIKRKSDINLRWAEKINNFPISNGECSLNIYAFDSNPKRWIKMNDKGKIEYQMEMKDSTVPRSKVEVLDNNDNVALKGSTGYMTDDKTVWIWDEIDPKDLPPGIYKLRIFLSLRTDSKPHFRQYYDIGSFTIDFPRPVCKKNPYPLHDGESVAVMCKNEGSYYPTVNCSIIEDNRLRHDGVTVSEKNLSNGKWTHYCHFVKTLIRTDETRTVRFRAEMSPVLSSDKLKPKKSVSNDTDAVKFESPKLVSQSSVSRFAMNGSRVEVTTKWKAFPPPNVFHLQNKKVKTPGFTFNYTPNTKSYGTLVLRMTNLKTSDIGAFTLTVSNVFGSADYKFDVIN